MRRNFISKILMAFLLSLTAVSPALAFQVTEIIPANRTEVTTLTSITLKLDKPLGEWHPESLPLKIANAPLTYEAVIYPKDFSQEVTISIEPELDIPGTYEIVIPTGCLWDENFEYLPELSLIYAVENGSTPPEDMVRYDLTYTMITPEAGNVESPISDVTIVFEDEIFVMPETEEHYVRGRVYNESDMLLSNGRIEKTDDKTVSVRLNNTISAKGRYTFIIEKGLIGDAAWNADNSKGHANKEIRVEYKHSGNNTSATACTDMPHVHTQNNSIIIDGIATGTKIELHSVSGNTILQTSSNSSQITIDNLSHGLYVLKVGDTVQKIIIK